MLLLKYVMSGIYFHIPFCKKKCNYCDFYSVRNSDGIDELVNSEIKELGLRKEYIGKTSVNTIYFGGGTPSLLSVNHIDALLNTVKKYFVISENCEITFEANPEDLSEAYLDNLFQVGINRLSIGIQSLNNDILNFLGRRHDNSKLIFIIDTAKKAGFRNISVDLIFGIPGLSYMSYIDSIMQVIKLEVQHISAYSLTLEENTYLFKLFKKGNYSEVSEDELLKQFNATIDMLSENGFFQYEISNYAREGYESIHNSSYWDEVSYLGIGPSSHSYNIVSRQWNVSNLSKYCSGINESKCVFEVEILNENDKFNEYLIKRLRTAGGISLKYIENTFNDIMCKYFHTRIKELFEDGLINFMDDTISLTRRGIFLSDYVLRILYFVP
jgi:oxygen-independent coproporphyrinogen-3 oxidase